MTDSRIAPSAPSGSDAGRAPRTATAAAAGTEAVLTAPALDAQSLAANVAADPSALGVTSLAMARQSELRYLAVDGVDASPDSLAAGAYPLFQPLRIAVAGGDDLAERFVRFAQSPLARRILRRNGTVPYMDGLGLVSHQFERENRLRKAARHQP